MVYFKWIKFVLWWNDIEVGVLPKGQGRLVFTEVAHQSKGWALTLLMRGFGLSKKLSIKFRFAFTKKKFEITSVMI